MPPLVELHTHLEGSIAPPRLIALAERHGAPSAAAACLTADGSRFRPCDGFPGFLEIYKAVTAVIRTPADHHVVALDLARALADDGVIYCEATVSYGVLLRRGIDPRPIHSALHEAAAEALERHGVEIRWLPDAARQFGVAAARAVLEAAAASGARLGVVGFGIGGDEAAVPAADFSPVCAEARSAGLGVTIHAGETGGPDAVREAVLACGATRIGHGVGAVLGPVVGWAAASEASAGAPLAASRRAPDPRAVEEALSLLAAGRVFVELCPGSNRATGVVPDLAAHPLRALLARGVPCCLNTDDRGLFGLDLHGEYERAAQAHGLSSDETAAMQRAALAASFADEVTRAAVSDRLAAAGD